MSAKRKRSPSRTGRREATSRTKSQALGEARIHSISALLEAIEKLADSWTKRADIEDVRWFRGIDSGAHRLVPGAYWQENADEVALLNSFYHRSPGYLTDVPRDEWDWYVLMQHYGMPTRLLDWTENPLVALYFAIRSHPSGQTPCIWMINPGALNKLATKGTDGEPIYPGGGFTKYWLPSREKPFVGVEFTFENKGYSNQDPIAILPPRTNARILAQRGAFTLHGARNVCLRDLLIDSGDASLRMLSRINIDPAAIEALRSELALLGIQHSSLFPELQSVVEDIKVEHGVRRPDPVRPTNSAPRTSRRRGRG
ncbi:MAG: FRG domain-containing protein [Planctomycetota bacterium]